MTLVSQPTADEIVLALAATDPTAADEVTGDGFCTLCYQPVPGLTDRGHAPTCPWVLACTYAADADPLTRAGKTARDAIGQRDALIRDAVAAGRSLRDVGAAVGLSHTAVKFIAHGRP